jgi:type II secretory pathway component GspD/PulD (secretin)
VRIAIPQPTMPRPIDLKETYWYVVSDKNLEEFLNTVKKQSGNKVVFAAMTIADYENMAYNMQEIKRYVEQSKAVILYYVESTKVEEPKVEE